jgi:hypothetical protein
MQEKLLNQRSSVHGRIAFHLSDQVRFANPHLLIEICLQSAQLELYTTCMRLERS